MISGSFVALVTPFNELEKIDFFAFEQLIRWHIAEGTDGLVVAGCTGEGLSLSFEEKCTLFKTAVAVGKGKIQLIATTGTNQTAESALLTKEAKKIGVDGCMAIVPYCNKPTEEGCWLHFNEIAKVDLPLIVYHHPGRTGVRLSVKGLLQICDIPQVVGIKDSSGDFALFNELLRQTDTPLISGDDHLALAQLSIGLKGVVSVVGNVVPKQWKKFIDHALTGDLLEARKDFFDLYELCNAMSLEVNPQCVKFAVSLLGKCEPYMRLPLIEPKIENQQKIRASLRTVELALQ